MKKPSKKKKEPTLQDFHITIPVSVRDADGKEEPKGHRMIAIKVRAPDSKMAIGVVVIALQRVVDLSALVIPFVTTEGGGS